MYTSVIGAQSWSIWPGPGRFALFGVGAKDATIPFGYGSTAMDRPERLNFTESDEANELLAKDGLAVLLGMLLDQQFPMERAFLGPQILKERLGEDLDEERIANWDPDELAEVFRGPPAIHQYWSAMSKRAQALCRILVDDYAGKAENIWGTVDSGAELLKRLKALPGFGDAKSRIFVGLLGKRLGVRPEGWEEKAADWASIADVAEFDDVAVLREQKRAMKAARKD
jgi:uncharacterized HhH-GPD family protein